MLFKEYINRKSKYSNIRDQLFDSVMQFKKFIKPDSNNKDYLHKAFFIFDYIFKNTNLFNSLKTPFKMLGKGDNRGAFLYGNDVVIKVNIAPTIDENKEEKNEILKLEKIPLAKYFFVPLLADDKILNETVLYFPLCQNIDTNSLSQEQKMHIDLIKQLFLDTAHTKPTTTFDGLTQKNIMQLQNGMVCIDMQSGTTNEIHNLQNNEVFKKLSQTNYWKNWTKYIDTYYK